MTEVLIERNKNKLEEFLDNEKKEIFEKYVDCMNEYIDLVCEQSFCNGFCLGAKILSEAVSDTEEML